MKLTCSLLSTTDVSTTETLSSFEELLEQFVALEEADEAIRESLAYRVVAKRIADGDIVKAGSSLER